MQTAGDGDHYLMDVRGDSCSDRYVQLTRAGALAKESEDLGTGAGSVRLWARIFTSL